MNLTRIYDAILTLAYPQVCVICGKSVEQRRFGVACETCWSETQIFTDEERICFSQQFAFEAAWAVGRYEGALRESLLLLKRQPYLPRHVESLLIEVVRHEPLSHSTRVIPVPLHPKRLKTRGFNQASIIGQTVSKALQLPLDEVSLVRVSTTEKYRAGMDTKGRRDTVAGAFRVSHPRLVAGESILLVDDVFTTGATISACADVLVAAGAGNVFVLTVARAR
jgi:ComF family protein